MPETQPGRFIAALASDIGEDAAIDALATALRGRAGGKNVFIQALSTALGNREAIGVLKAELGKHQKTRITDLPREVIALILCHLTLAHDIAKVARTSRGFRDAVRHAFVARPFSGEIVTIHSPLHEKAGANKRGVLCATVALDGRVITGLADKTVNVHGLRSLRVKAHTAEVKAVATMPDGRFMTASIDKTVKVWKRDGSLECSIAVGGNAISIAVLPDGVHFVVGISFRDATVHAALIGEVRLYDFAGSLIHNFQGHVRPVRALAVTSDGQHIISGASLLQVDAAQLATEERRVMVWSVAEKRLLHECTWSGGKGGVNALAVMPDDQRFLSGGHDRTVRVWLVKKQAMTFNDEGAKVALGNGEFKDIGEDGSHKYYCGRRLPIPGTDGRCGPTGGPQCRSCIRFQERKELGDKKTVVHSELELMMGEVKVRHAGAVNALVALPDNKHALSASADKTIKLFSVPNVGDYWSDDPAIGTVLRTFKHHCWSTSRWNAVKCLALLPDGLRFVSGSYDGTACIVYHGLAP